MYVRRVFPRAGSYSTTISEGVSGSRNLEFLPITNPLLGLEGSKCTNTWCKIHIHML